MIYLRLCGGLGNQLFQLAAASLFSRRQQAPVTVFLNSLERYNIHREPDFLQLLRANDWLIVPENNKKKLANWMSVSFRVGRLAPVFGVTDHNFWVRLPSSISTSSWPTFLDGYFQSGWAHHTFQEALSAMPVKPISNMAAQKLSKDEVLIHIRGRDFLTLPSFQVVNVPFYVQAVQQALKRGKNKFAIMTDDPDYAREICNSVFKKISEATFRFLPTAASTLEDFDIIRFASSRIIGNSTFAWWAAALGDPENTTWAPTQMTVGKSRDFYLMNEIPIVTSLI